MSQVFTSFAELARVFGSEIKAKEKIAHGSYLTVETDCGHKAAVIWAVLQDREACRLYGDNGKIILTPVELAEITGYTLSSVIGCLISLVRRGHVRPTSDGKAVKAA